MKDYYIDKISYSMSMFYNLDMRCLNLSEIYFVDLEKDILENKGVTSL